ncbi:hypothetical protein B0H14DRAFT_2559352 [Mycena olivaceomarginata]|nr:hypothetical protein B0H14DRAFT_2559352 [Mycena olivaceomarginata]
MGEVGHEGQPRFPTLYPVGWTSCGTSMVKSICRKEAATIQSVIKLGSRQSLNAAPDVRFPITAQRSTRSSTGSGIDRRATTRIMAYTVFDYMRGQVEVLTLPVAVAISVSGQTIRVDPDLWFDRMLRAVASHERMGLHVMLLRDGEEAKLDSVARLGSFEDGTAGFIEAAENLEITEGTVEIH